MSVRGVTGFAARAGFLAASSSFRRAFTPNAALLYAAIPGAAGTAKGACTGATGAAAASVSALSRATARRPSSARTASPRRTEARHAW
jgi:hypothetical protein